MRRTLVRSRSSTLKWVAAAAVAAAVVAAVAAVLLARPLVPRASETDTAPSGAARVSPAAATAFPPESIDGRIEVPVPGDLVDVCGLGRVSRQPGGDLYPPTVVEAANIALSKAAAQLASAADPLQRAVGLYVQASLEERRAPLSAAVRDLTAELARAAVSGREPAVYALAFYRCNKSRAATAVDASCSLISAANWAQLEPDNAVAWLYLAGAERQDERARDEALYRASRARASRLHWNSIAALTETQFVKQQTAETRSLLHAQARNLYVSFAPPNFSPVMRFCSPALTSDAARRQVCSDLAAVFADHGTTLLELTVGTRLGARMGWAPDRVAALRDRADAVQALLSEDLAQSDASSCRHLATLESRNSDFYRYGELGAAERRIQASGRSVAERAQQWRSGQSTPRRGASAPPVGIR